MTKSSEAGRAAPCGECGMPCEAGEFHPFAACLMFKACHNSETVRANLEAVRRAPVAPLPAAGGWLPMHKAPRDGTRILIAVKDDGDGYQWKQRIAAAWEASDEFKTDDGMEFPDQRLHGWQHIPKFPAPPPPPLTAGTGVEAP